MSFSQNVRFVRDGPPDNEVEHPLGAALTRMLQEQIRAAVFELAQVVHRALTEDPRCSRIRWLWDGFPEDESADCSPVEYRGGI